MEADGKWRKLAARVFRRRWEHGRPFELIAYPI
jgi:hypothetical protein